MKIIDGVIFGSGAYTTAALTDEIEEMSTHVDLLALAGGRARVFQVSGDSASPVALNGEYLLVEDPIPRRFKLSTGIWYWPPVMAGQVTNTISNA